MSTDHGPSAPPLSPLPTPPSKAEEEAHPHRRRSDSIAGWVPADEDETPRAMSWRSRKALKVALRVEAAQVKLSDSIDKLTSTIDAWSTTWAARWKTAGKVALFVGGPVVIAAALGAAASLWQFLSTLHH